MAMLLGDDGTLDTVIVCSECGEEMRYNFDDGDQPRKLTAGESARAYRAFVAWAKQDAAAEHECEVANGNVR